jgi:hypothetical protein
VSQPSCFGLGPDRAGQAALALGRHASGPPHPGTVTLGQNPSPAPVQFSFSFRLKKIPRKCVKLQKNHGKQDEAPKMQNKFLWNPFEHIYSINLTKFTFDLCCLL